MASLYGVGHCAWRAAAWAALALPLCMAGQAAFAQAATSQSSGKDGSRRGAATKPPAKPSPASRANHGKQGTAAKPPAVPTVGQQCSGKGYWAREWCELKACFKAEHQSDPLCKQRRDQRPFNQP